MRDTWGFTRDQVEKILIDWIETNRGNTIDRVNNVDLRLVKVEKWGGKASFAIKLTVDHEE